MEAVCFSEMIYLQVNTVLQPIRPTSALLFIVSSAKKKGTYTLSQDIVQNFGLTLMCSEEYKDSHFPILEH
jgi:hypothetical protein